MSAVHYLECWDWIKQQSNETLMDMFNEHTGRSTHDIIETPWGKKEHRGDVLEHLRSALRDVE